MSRNLRDYTKALYGFDAVVQRVPDDRWDAASPCEGWCARDVVAHTAGVLDAVAAMARTGTVAMPQMPDAGSDPHNVRAGWATSRDGVLEALDHPAVINQRGDYWFGDATIDDILAFSMWDTLIHSWDLGRAVGLEPHASAELAETSLATLTPMADGLRAMKLMGDPVDVADGADAYTRLLAFTGRRPGSA